MRMTPSALSSMFVFFFNDTATTAIYTLSLHDALPIYAVAQFAERHEQILERNVEPLAPDIVLGERIGERSEEHTSELQSHSDLVCRLLLEKKKTKTQAHAVQIRNKTIRPKFARLRPHS